MVARLAEWTARDHTNAVPDLRPPDRLDGAAGTVRRIERRRAAGAAPGGSGTAAAEPQTEAGLGRSRRDRRPGPAAPQTAADEPAGNPGDVAALAPAAGPLAVDLPPPWRTPACRCPARITDRADGAGEPRLWGQADPGRAARA